MFSIEPGEKEQALRQSFNTAIQGSVADCFKQAIIKGMSDSRFKFRVGVFDSFLYECDESVTEKDAKAFFDYISTFNKFAFKFDYSEGHSWLECQEKA